MGQILLPDKIGYKANLHCHTTDSDGFLTPEQVKKLYMEKGYSIVAYTDHLYMRDRTPLNDDKFVALNGYENNILQWDMTSDNNKINPIEAKCYHLNFYSPKPDKLGMVGVVKFFHDNFNRNKSYEDKALCPVIGEYYPEGGYSKELAQKSINEGIALGYLVVYNHPVWSRHDESDYLGLKGLCGMEIFNTGSFLGGYAEDNEYIYDLMLRDGQKICCFANDDNHNLPNRNDSFFGYNVMYPKKLDYESVFDCMKRGDSYASTGGTIRGIAVENEKVYVGAENASVIQMKTNGRYTGVLWAKEKPINSAVFNLNENITYFRIVVKDDKGKAYSRAYFRNRNGEWE